MSHRPNKSPEPTAVGAVPFRCRGSRRESAVAQLFSLGGIAHIMRFFILIAFLAVVAGCRHPASTSQRLTPLPSDPPVYRTPTKLASQIAGADLVVVTNIESTPIDLPHIGFSLSGSKAKEIGLAISSGRHYESSIPSGILWEWEIRFYRGTSYIASVPFEGSAFIGDGGFLYDDESGALDKLYREVLRRTMPPWAK